MRLLTAAETLPVTRSTCHLSIVIPVYNQEKNIQTVLTRMRNVLSQVTNDYEFIIVNDGSSDNTLPMLREEQKADSRIRIVTYAQNMGKGYAVRMGVLQSTGHTVIFTDGDLDISPNIITRHIDEANSYDIIIASKEHPLSRVEVTFSRRILSKTFNMMVRLIVGIKQKDTQSGLKSGNGEILRTIFGMMQVKRYAFDVELIAIANMLSLRIGELPIEIRLDKRFKFREITKMFLDVVGISYRLRILRSYQKQMQLVGLDSN